MLAEPVLSQEVKSLSRCSSYRGASSASFEMAASKFSNLCWLTYLRKRGLKPSILRRSDNELRVKYLPPFLPSGCESRSDSSGSVARLAREVSRSSFWSNIQRERDIAALSYFRRWWSFNANAAKRERNWSSQDRDIDGCLNQ